MTNTHNIEIWGIDESGTLGKDITFCISQLDEEYEYLPFLYNLAYFDELIVDKHRFMHKLENDTPQVYEFLKAIKNCDKIDFKIYSMLSCNQIDIISKFINLEFDSIFLTRGKLHEGIEKSDEDILWESFSELNRFDRRKEKNYYAQHQYLKNKLNSYDDYLDKFIKSYSSFLIFNNEYKRAKIINDPKIEPFLVLTFVDGGMPHSCWYTLIQDKHTPIYGVARGDETHPSMYIAGVLANSYRFLSQKRHSFIFSDYNIENILPTTRPELEDMIKVYERFKEIANSPTYSNRVKIMGDIDKYIPIIKNIIPYLLHKEIRHNKRYKYTIFEHHLGELEDLRKRDYIIYTDDMEDKVSEFDCKKISLNVLAKKLDVFIGDLQTLVDEIVLSQGRSSKITKKLTYIKTRIVPFL